ncbi:uncharacterized protein N7482_000118 [Penicillium canariense]|uniref:Uncharacterized protein n=1 Tax=Penicillium canariense TaxID=189055 RepID=A0A9W9IEQ2_9EURO|nr:uncharacterized protein N7482_000118 [Penicillium canariense]KAJ5174241.1 hypothetical protein N7482_000118 [Penicillium canariense]
MSNLEQLPTRYLIFELVSPHPRVVMMNRKLDLIAYGHGPKGPIWRTVTLHDLMNEDGVGGLSPKGLAVRLVWTEADKAKKEAERKGLQPDFREEWLERHNQEIKELEGMRRDLPSGAESSYIDGRLKEVKDSMAKVPEMPVGWSSKKFELAREK